jgi:antitoxin component of RelBE/YafQ-DinJ toxin-antitoxin module
MQEGYQIVEPKNRVSDVLTQMSIKVSDVLILLGQRCADSYQLVFKYSQIFLKLWAMDTNLNSPVTF